jgi:hypothetical protein
LRTVYAVFDPSNIRSTNAAFDPAKSSSSNILATPPELGGAFVGGALGGTQGETPEERARNALLGAAGGAIGGRLARGAAIDQTRMGSNLGNIPKPVQKAQAQGYEGADIGEAQEWVSARSKGLDMSQPARMQRAQEMGFDTVQVLYHGTSSDFKSFKPSKTGEFGPGVYLTTSPNEAAAYTATNERGANAGKNILPVIINTKRLFNANNEDFWTTFADKTDEEVVRRAQAAGFDGVKYKRPVSFWDDKTKQIVQTGEMQEHIVIFDPSNIRSVNAAFDPASKESANILAGVGAVGAGAAMMPREAEAQTVGSERRPDGTKKGLGYFGEIPITFPNGDTGVATEYSTQSQAVKVDGKMIDFPTLVPTLTPDEVRIMATDIIPNRKPIPETIMQKAIAHARKRLAAGQSVYADQKKPPGQRQGG